MRRRFFTLDVFTNRRFAGNPLAVVLDADQLDGAAMQAIAREFNLSETVFVLDAADPAHRARLRIFTPTAELPFAGHPTIGTAVLIGKVGGGGRCAMVLEEAIGNIWCEVVSRDPDSGYAQFELPRLPEPAGPAAKTELLAAALGIEASEIGFEHFVPACWSAGLAFQFVPVSRLAAIRKCRVVPAAWNELEEHGPASVFVFCRETLAQQSAFHARMFAPSFGVPEDPATGSAAAAFAGVLAKYGGLADGAHRFRIEQGYEMGRPSLIELSLMLRAGKLASAAIAGEAVLVTEGMIEA